MLGCNTNRNKPLTNSENKKNEERHKSEEKHKSELVNYNHIKVKRVIDGDTFELENGEKVRLLGIDTPEKRNSKKMDNDVERSKKDKNTIKKLGGLASQYTDNALKGKYVKLIPDSTNSDRDRYSRLLRYAYLENGEFFNLKIIQDGFAYAYTRYPIIYLEEFRTAEREARENKKGLWIGEKRP